MKRNTWILFAAAFLALLAGCGSTGGGLSRQGKAQQASVGIIGAVQQEVDILCESLENAQTVSTAGIDFYVGTLSGVPVVVARCGVGKVFSALCAQAMIDRFGVSRIINTGAAGGTEEGLRVLDMVACTDAVHHDMDVTAFGYPMGQVPGVEGISFAADERMRLAAIKAFEGFDMDFYQSIADGGDREVFASLERLPIIKEGRVASGDVFVANDALRSRIAGEFAASCVEMEGAAIAQVACANGVPFLILRSVSDLAGEDAGISYEDFSRLAARISSAVVRAMMDAASEWL